MKHKLEQYAELRKKEIDKHKYHMSEDVGYDVGMDRAIMDWEIKHESAFRLYHFPKREKDET